MKNWPYWTVATLALAGIFHIIAVLGFPYFIMDRLVAGAADGEGLNTAIHAERATSDARRVVRPSPDLIYTLCAFDLREGPLVLSAPVPDTYWSLSMFSDNTDNFFVVNDQQLEKDTIELVLARRESQVQGHFGVPIVVSPSDTGAILFRTLIASEDRFGELDALRRQANCEPM